MFQVIALGCLAVVLYAYLLFPLLVLLRAKLRPKAWQSAQITPRVSLVIICHNEEASIGAKLANVLSLDYPAEQLEVIVASDGSTDATELIVRSCPDSRVTLHSYPRRGKIPALNEAVASASGEILIFSDANSQFQPQALRQLVQHFADLSIGCVAGNQVYTREHQAGAAAAGEQTYWNYDRAVKLAESKAGNAISATGAIYAIRRELFEPVPSGVTDDFTISTRVIRQGYRLVFEPEAIATEPVAGKPRAEYRRKVRVMTRGFRSVWVARPLLNPLHYGFYALQLFSHKVVRRLVVLPLLVLLAVSPWLWQSSWPFRLLVVAQAALYLPALLGFALAHTRLGRVGLLAVPYYFCLVNLAALAAFGNVMLGRKIERWDSSRTEPQRESDARSLVEQQVS